MKNQNMQFDQMKPKTYRNLWSQISKTLYYCECGKRYQSFPALYLHFKRKHSFILATRGKQQNCVIQQVGSYRIHKYFYSSVGAQKIRSRVSELFFNKIIIRFLSDCSLEITDKAMSEQCLQDLISFVYEEEEFETHTEEESIIQKIPYKLNSFILQKQSNLSKSQFSNWSKTLIYFSKWLYQNKFCSSFIEQNQDYKPTKTDSQGQTKFYE